MCSCGGQLAACVFMWGATSCMCVHKTMVSHLSNFCRRGAATGRICAVSRDTLIISHNAWEAFTQCWERRGGGGGVMYGVAMKDIHHKGTASSTHLVVYRKNNRHSRLLPTNHISRHIINISIHFGATQGVMFTYIWW